MDECISGEFLWETLVNLFIPAPLVISSLVFVGVNEHLLLLVIDDDDEEIVFSFGWISMGDVTEFIYY